MKILRDKRKTLFNSSEENWLGVPNINDLLIFLLFFFSLSDSTTSLFVI